MRSALRVSLCVAAALAAGGSWPAPAGAVEAGSAALRGGEAAFENWLRDVERGAPDVLVNNAAGGASFMRRCATAELAEPQRRVVEESLALWDELFPETEARRTVPVAVHIVYKASEGNVSDADVAAQIDVLNHGFRNSNFRFTLASIDRKKKARWYKRCTKEGILRRMTNRLAIDPAETVNLYTCGPQDGTLGLAVLPFFLEEDDPLNFMLVHWATLPNGPFFPYDEGDTAVHEMGHYLGLYHTFQGACVDPGDFVNDTPFEAEPAFGCPVGRNTCPQAGNDPVTNYMDYSDDACLVKFSRGQKRRMKNAVAVYRPSLGD